MERNPHITVASLLKVAEAVAKYSTLSDILKKGGVNPSTFYKVREYLMKIGALKLDVERTGGRWKTRYILLEGDYEISVMDFEGILRIKIRNPSRVEISIIKEVII